MIIYAYSYRGINVHYKISIAKFQCSLKAYKDAKKYVNIEPIDHSQLSQGVRA